ncbi:MULTISPECIES: hypothetical protein [unclassified Nocardia]|uniref:hypothetical protein n=1 Tax=unclassified Nocardia TaxID=2637762 RepID=UPI001CE3EEB8|nr:MULTISPECIES: hypothetical protein [unclassified Nocardia]
MATFVHTTTAVAGIRSVEYFPAYRVGSGRRAEQIPASVQVLFGEDGDVTLELTADDAHALMEALAVALVQHASAQRSVA